MERIKEYGVHVPESFKDQTLVCPSYTKNVHENSLLLKIIDAT